MKRVLTVCVAIAALALAGSAQEKKAPAPTKKAAPEKSLALKDLPAAVQKTIQDNLKGGEIKNIGKETEDGVQQYEIETILAGKHRDFNVDTKGTLLVLEEETSIDSIPAAAKAGILKKVAVGKLGMVELFHRGGETMYEAAYTSKDGKHHEVLVKADGTGAKRLYADDRTGPFRLGRQLCKQRLAPGMPPAADHAGMGQCSAGVASRRNAARSCRR